MEGRDGLFEWELGDQCLRDMPEGVPQGMTSLQVQAENIDSGKLSFTLEESLLSGFLIPAHPSQDEVRLGQDREERTQWDRCPVDSFEQFSCIAVDFGCEILE